MKRRSSKGTKALRNKLDAVFSKLVRERAGWICECCGTPYPENSAGLHCSHLFSRRHKMTRWCAENAVAHCAGCHIKLGGNPIEFAEWIQNHLGAARTAALRDLKEQVCTWKAPELQRLLDHLNAEHAYMLQQRRSGVTGRIGFEAGPLFARAVA